MYRKPLIAAAVSLAFVAAACQSTQYQADNIVDYLLFAPTYNPMYVPQVYGTPYECRTAAARYGGANVWRANIGGRVFDIDQQRPVGREACFQTQAECFAFLNLMEGYIDMVISRTCTRGYG
ncbi:hypothetical protein H2509_18230 [Stappia sp. F7233]|uniref:Uncharacterized protein n=1 Tax=Stappia albiluteola TaxID=2758565 RepID=A0A839AH83_9HYPH|nr:hypothetical protein [Stappia albiluteola]MBA5779071.1 hypothetical protein [Stappia albiluteola]